MENRAGRVHEPAPLQILHRALSRKRAHGRERGNDRVSHPFRCIIPNLACPFERQLRPTRSHVSHPCAARAPAVGPLPLLVVAALGITWILDGLEVTLAGSVAGALKASPALAFLATPRSGLPAAPISSAPSSARLFFGWLTDRLGPQEAVLHHHRVYLIATALTGLSWNAGSFFLFRFLTGAGIGGEYAAINSTIQELDPGALSRPHRSHHQRQLLDRRGARRARRRRAARSRR